MTYSYPSFVLLHDLFFALYLVSLLLYRIASPVSDPVRNLSVLFRSFSESFFEVEGLDRSLSQLVTINIK